MKLTDASPNPPMKNNIPDQSASSIGVRVQRLVRLPFSSEEDADIRYCYEVANGTVLGYATQACQLNERYHGGKPVRSPSAVRRREGKILRGLA